jgi:hypothetical protein
MKKIISIVLLFFLFNQCVLVNVNTSEKIISKKEIQKPETYIKIGRKYFLKSTFTNDNINFQVFETITKKTYSRIKFKAKVKEINHIKKNKKGEWKYYFAGPAWVVEIEGKKAYFKNFAFSILLSFGVSIFIAIGDWISLPFRLGETEKEKIIKEGKKLSEEDETLTFQRKSKHFLQIKKSKKVELVSNKAIFSFSEIFKDSYYTYPFSKISFNIYKENNKRIVRQKVLLKTIMSQEEFYKRYLPLIQDKQTKQRVLLDLIRLKDIENIKKLFKKNIDLNFSEKYLEPPLHIAILTVQPKIVEFLLENGAKIETQNRRKKNASEYLKERIKNEKKDDRKKKLLEIEKKIKKYEY